MIYCLYNNLKCVFQWYLSFHMTEQHICPHGSIIHVLLSFILRHFDLVIVNWSYVHTEMYDLVSNASFWGCCDILWQFLCSWLSIQQNPNWLLSGNIWNNNSYQKNKRIVKKSFLFSVNSISHTLTFLERFYHFILIKTSKSSSIFG